MQSAMRRLLPCGAFVAAGTRSSVSAATATSVRAVPLTGRSLCAAVHSCSAVGAHAARCFSTQHAAAVGIEIRERDDVVAARSSGKPIPDSVLVAPKFGTQSTTDKRFMYLKGVKTDGRTKRFYNAVTLEAIDTVRGPEVAVLLDGRYIVTHHDQVLSAPTWAAAQGLAFEFDAQGDFIRPVSMPMTEMAVTALDQAFDNREKFIKHFRNAMHTDSVLLRVQSPSGLVLQQRRQWDPLLSWFRSRYSCDLQTTFEIETPVQPEEATQRQQQLLESLNGWQLAALDQLCTVTKSFVISWALLCERLTVSQAFEAARLEENWQMRAYGKVEGVYGHGIDMEFVRMNMAAAKTFCNFVADGKQQQPELIAHPQQQQNEQQ